jgi:inosine-uridine nucleoside N-ribohydrolase
MHDPLALAVLLDDSLLDFTLANVEIIESDDRNRGASRILLPDSSQLSADGFQRIHVASAVDGSRFVDLFLSRIMEE